MRTSPMLEENSKEIPDEDLDRQDLADTLSLVLRDLLPSDGYTQDFDGYLPLAGATQDFDPFLPTAGGTQDFDEFLPSGAGTREPRSRPPSSTNQTQSQAESDAVDLTSRDLTSRDLTSRDLTSRDLTSSNSPFSFFGARSAQNTTNLHFPSPSAARPSTAIQEAAAGIIRTTAAITTSYTTTESTLKPETHENKRNNLKSKKSPKSKRGKKRKLKTSASRREKNRVAAQLSRDRKKQKLNEAEAGRRKAEKKCRELEARVATLESENKILRDEAKLNRQQQIAENNVQNGTATTTTSVRDVVNMDWDQAENNAAQEQYKILYEFKHPVFHNTMRELYIEHLLSLLAEAKAEAEEKNIQSYNRRQADPVTKKLDDRLAEFIQKHSERAEQQSENSSNNENQTNSELIGITWS